MIVPDSPKNEISTHHSSTSGQTSFGREDAPSSPPPYSATVASGVYYQDGGHSSHSTGFNTASSVRPNLPPRCNHFIDRKVFSSVSGTWHVDTALEIPEGLLLPIPKFDGYWNREAQRTRKTRADELRKRQERASNSVAGRPLPPVETRPNLMLATTNGMISGDIHVMSSDGLIRQTTLVTQGFNGLVNLKIHAPPNQPLRVFASTTNGSINIKIPSSFEGAVMMSTTWGSVNISEPIKAKLTTFSSTPNASRGFVGDWQAQGFGVMPDSTDLVGNSACMSQSDPFATWTGPFVEIASTNGSVSLSFTEEGMISTYIDQFTKAVQGFKDNWFGGGKSGSPAGGSSSALPLSTPQSPQPGAVPTRSKAPDKHTGMNPPSSD